MLEIVEGSEDSWSAHSSDDAELDISMALPHVSKMYFGVAVSEGKPTWRPSKRRLNNVFWGAYSGKANKEAPKARLEKEPSASTLPFVDAVEDHFTKLFLATPNSPKELSLQERKNIRAIAAAIYKPEFRSGAPDIISRLTVHLKDPLNGELRNRILSGNIAPRELALMDEMDLANPVARAEMNATRQRELDSRDMTTLLLSRLETTSLHTCPKCGHKKQYVHERQANNGKWGGEDPLWRILQCVSCGFSFTD